MIRNFNEMDARIIVQSVLNQGHTKEEAYEALAYVLGATVEQIKEHDVFGE